MATRPDLGTAIARRTFLSRSTSILGNLALASLLSGREVPAAGAGFSARQRAPRARRVIHLFMSGGPSQLELFDPKPRLIEWMGQELPPSVRGDQRITGMTAVQDKLLLLGSPYRFSRCGRSGVEISELLPHTAAIADDIALVRSLHIEPINHDPAATLFFTGSSQVGRPSMGAWLSYGLGAINQDLPEFLVLTSGSGGQSLKSRYWGNGFLPGKHQGVQLHAAGDPVLDVSNPPGMDTATRRRIVDGIQALDRVHLANLGDPEIATRINACEMAFRMQASVPEIMDISKEPAEVQELYGATPGRASFANNCLLARRLAEYGVRFILLCHRDWDHHSNLHAQIKLRCTETDRPAAALMSDLKRRGLLEDTLVLWSGEFGRTAYAQGNPQWAGRDHHSRCFSAWLAGGGIPGGTVVGETDEFGYNVIRDPVHVHDLHATMLHLLGVDHEQLTYRYQGRDFRLTDVGGRVVPQLLGQAG